MNTQDNKEEKGWQFLNIGIAGPECMMPFIEKIVQSAFEKELEKVDGIFSSEVDIPFEDESLDEFLCVEVYGLHGSFSTFQSELHRYKVDEVTFGKDWTRAIFAMLKGACDFIKDNTDKPLAIKNNIISILKLTEDVPILGLMSQIAVLWGLVRMLECCGMNEDEPQYNDFITLHDWLVVEAGKRMCEFTIKPVTWIFSDEDMKRVQPFCDYLYYGTDIGKLANEMALGLVEGDSDTHEESFEESVATIQNPTSKESATKVGRPKGKTIEPIQKNLNGSTEEKTKTLATLHKFIDGKKGRYVALVITACIEAGKMKRPSFRQMQNEFGDIGAENGYNAPMREKPFTKNEINDIIGYFQD